MVGSPGSARTTDPAVTALVCAAISDPSPKGIAAALNRLIRAGRLTTGERLPTVRDLAVRLGVSPATVSEAWQALSAVGAIESRGRAGTFIQETSEPSRPVRYLSVGLAPSASGIDLSTSMPDPLLLPSLRTALEAVTGNSLAWTTSYLEDPVLPALEALLRSSWPYDPARLVTVDGALDGLARVIEQVVGLGDRVAMENPGFPALIDLLESRGAEIIPMAMDDSGVLPQELARALEQDPVAVFMHPRAQNPTGAAFTPARLGELVKVLRPFRAIVIETDHSGAIAESEDLSVGSFLVDRTVRIRSYSKSHGPDLRIAALSGPAHIVDPLMARRMLGPGWTSRILQSVLVQLLVDPHSQASVAHAAGVYSRRTFALKAALEEKGVRASPGDGLNIWVEVNDERSALLTLAAAGIRVAPGSPFMVEPLPAQFLRITSGLLPDEPEELAEIAGHVVVAARVLPSARGGIS
ncbi:MAG: aminotransferase class I/II-fold pyridoxal phosphate-dependent enzyme [Actinobacteria bacterium]|nr:aminotransferase class I/II-fold pyridoxal phosphate-dependent enzyme [Actinomycetota bacterium]